MTCVPFTLPSHAFALLARQAAAAELRDGTYGKPEVDTKMAASIQHFVAEACAGGPALASLVPEYVARIKIHTTLGIDRDGFRFSKSAETWRERGCGSRMCSIKAGWEPRRGGTLALLACGGGSPAQEAIRDGISRAPADTDNPCRSLDRPTLDRKVNPVDPAKK
ncbi:hypothetical protein FB451DRAFT_1185748 [Mycena latifolia]|nr:hypothetical protein FB451DRAFT_1185748 [Mycena latifolia]